MRYERVYNYTAGDEMEVRALNLVVSDGAESAERNWIIMSAWDVGVMLEHFSLRGNQNEGVQIVWGILDDDGIIGFNILRSTDKKGQYEKINPVLIQNIDENRFTFSDTYLEPGRDYYYKLECVSSGGGSFVFGPIALAVSVPQEWSLQQNYPNPFNSETIIGFSIPRASFVSLRIYNVSGAHICTIADRYYDAGRYSVFWNGKNGSGMDVSSGIYFCVLKSGNILLTRKMIVSK